jgi:putative phosphoesterase
MKIGLLSDTHSYLDKKVFDYFKLCDEIWHAGDIGAEEVVDQLENFKPLRAVFGNIDDRKLQSRYREDLFFTVEGLNIFMTHIGGVPPKYNPRVRKILMASPPDIFICGHSHILRVVRDQALANMLYLNPGAAGNHGFHHMKTMLRFDITGGEIKNMEVVELGKRGALEPIV